MPPDSRSPSKPNDTTDSQSRGIRETITVHDNYQFEIKQSYNLSLDLRDNSYHVKTYFFVPTNLNITNETYPRDDFYKDLRVNIRLETPSVLLNSIAADTGRLERLRECIDELSALPGRRTSAEFEFNLKMFSIVLKKAMSIQLRFIRESSKPREIRYFTDEYLSLLEGIIKDFRSLKPLLSMPVIPEDRRFIYDFTDEYISIKIESQSYALLEILKNKTRGLNKAYRGRIMGIIRREVAHRESCGYPSRAETTGTNEKFLFRQAALKKYMNNILFLETRTERGEQFLEQLLYSIAAGVAMIFATAIAFIGQAQYGTITLPFFIALVVSYMFKDRIKDLLRMYFYNQIHKWFYDRTLDIFHRFSERIGICKESFNHIKENQVPEMILQFRDRDNITDINNSMTGENIILYRRYIRFFPKQFQKIKRSYGTSGIVDIIRLNLQDFMRSMDDPIQTIFIPDGTTYKGVPAMRVYHINVITHYSINKKDFLKRFRIILNRKGIHRIDEVF